MRPGQRPCNAGRVENALRADEDLVDLFERAALGFGVEEMDRRNNAGVDDGEDDVVPVVDGAEADRRHLSEEEVEGPDGGGGYGANSSTELQRRDFGRVQVREASVPDGEGELENEQEYCGGNHGRRLIWRGDRTG